MIWLECLATCSLTESMRMRVRRPKWPWLTTGSTQMEKNSAPRLPLRAVSRLKLPSPSGSLRSKPSSTKRCGVSACVSMTMAELCTCCGVSFFVDFGEVLVGEWSPVCAHSSAGMHRSSEAVRMVGAGVRIGLKKVYTGGGGGHATLNHSDKSKSETAAMADQCA